MSCIYIGEGLSFPRFLQEDVERLVDKKGSHFIYFVWERIVETPNKAIRWKLFGAMNTESFDTFVENKYNDVEFYALDGGGNVQKMNKAHYRNKEKSE